MTKADQVRIDYPEEPAVVTVLHVQDRVTSTVAGAPKAWRKRTPFDKLFDDGRLEGGLPANSAKDRYMAGLIYADLFLLVEPSGKDSTDVDRVNKSLNGLPFSQCQATAGRTLAAIQRHMAPKDHRIVMMVCGQEYQAAEAVRIVCGGFKDTVTDRFREAVDGLIEGMAEARKAGFKPIPGGTK